jgi:hypothetical protein
VAPCAPCAPCGPTTVGVAANWANEALRAYEEENAVEANDALVTNKEAVETAWGTLFESPTQVYPG